MKYLEDLLYMKTKETQSEILLTQWNYDKTLVPKALQLISNLFPHYSLHDESHSIAIINNIVRILGKDAIDKLSAIDLWLILEASYYHDIGMVVSADILKEAVESKKFIQFFHSIRENKLHSLYEFAIKFKIENEKLLYEDSLFSFEQLEGIKYILADYFRSEHSIRSKKIIKDPTSEFNLTSPRNLMPQRIFKILGDICSTHTKDFSEVMKLSFCEVGIGTQDMHPRFVACLLRIGDLLDLDNNRFSEIMLSTLSTIPIDTTKHQLKHAAIESFRADRNEISILAKCDDYDVANITQHWFHYLADEISNQMSHWNEIVPCKDIGYLPSIGSLKVELKTYEYLDGKNKPHFSVDTDKALELLRGAGIYEQPSQAFREILQNSVDSTLIRMWEEHQDNETIFEEPYTEKFVKLMQNYPIQVSIKNTENSDKFKTWEVTIEDHAMGLTSYDLEFLMKSGSSSKNTKKANVVRSMPKWLQPSGIFGIGFQSIFQLTDEAMIKTKDFYEEQYQEITLYSPLSAKNGDILIEKKETTHKRKPGTQVIFKLHTQTIPDQLSYHYNDSNVKKTIDQYDYFSVDSMDIETAEIVDEIIKFSSNCYFPILLVFDDETLELSRINNKPFKYFDKQSSLEFNIYPNVMGTNRTITYYKNQVAKNNFFINFIGLAVNIHQDKASEVLTLNRNEIKKEYLNTLSPILFEALFRTITNHFNDFTSEEQIYLSMFLHYYNAKNLENSSITQYENWKYHKILIDGIEYSIEDLLKLDTITIRYCKDNIPNQTIKRYSVQDNSLTIELKNGHIDNEITTFLLFKANESFSAIRSSEENETYKKVVFLSKEEQKNPYSQEDFTKIIQSLIDTSSFTARVFLPCMIEEYNSLRLKGEAFAPWVHYHSSLSTTFQMPKMLSPYVVKREDAKTTLEVLTNDKLLEWVHQNRYYTSTTKEDIKNSYKTFIEDYNKIITTLLKEDG